MLERKDFKLKLNALDDETGEFDGYASVFGNSDSYGDIIEPGAFSKTIADKGGVFPILWQHDPYEPIGVSTRMGEDAYGLAVSGRLDMEVQRAREARSLIKMGAIGGLSIGYKPIKYEPIKDAGLRLREIRLYEFSPVTFPANELATITGVKAADDVIRAAATLVERSKAGAVLSAANIALVQQAVEALEALLSSAGVSDSDDEMGAASESDAPVLTTLREWVLSEQFKVYTGASA